MFSHNYLRPHSFICMNTEWICLVLNCPCLKALVCSSCYMFSDTPHGMQVKHGRLQLGQFDGSDTDGPDVTQLVVSTLPPHCRHLWSHPATANHRACYYKTTHHWPQKDSRKSWGCKQETKKQDTATGKRQDGGWWMQTVDSVAMETTDRRKERVPPVWSPDEGFPLSDRHGDLSRHAEVSCQQNTHTHRSITSI